MLATQPKEYSTMEGSEVLRLMLDLSEDAHFSLRGLWCPHDCLIEVHDHDHAAHLPKSLAAGSINSLQDSLPPSDCSKLTTHHD